ncbi:hypothetical protein BTVI_02491 [Pitangus sulphuratus]|nr:hypothetical protein BTVI_02491 [Pitangus sulphuratus]
MASRGAEAAVRQVAELEQELRGLAEELSCCQADKEFVCSLWKHLQVSSPDLMQAVSLAVERSISEAEPVIDLKSEIDVMHLHHPHGSGESLESIT